MYEEQERTLSSILDGTTHEDFVLEKRRAADRAAGQKFANELTDLNDLGPGTRMATSRC